MSKNVNNDEEGLQTNIYGNRKYPEFTAHCMMDWNSKKVAFR